MVPSTWKFLSIGLIAILAVGFAFPQGFAATADSVNAIVKDIQEKVNAVKATIDTNLDAKVSTRASQTSVNDVKTRTDSLPSDPADQSLIDTQLASIQSDTDDIQTELGSLSGGGSTPKFVKVNVSLNPATGSVADRINLIPFTGKMYSGIITGTIGVGSGNVVKVNCAVGGSLSNADVLVDFDETHHEFASVGSFSKVFTCPILEFFVFDINDGSEAGPAALRANIQYVEGTDITELTN